MKNTLKTSLILSALLLAASMSFGQTILTTTTLAGAITTSSTTNVALASATGVTANNTILFVADGGTGEAMFVNSVNGTNIGVTRGYQTLGKARPHLKGALVFVAPAGPEAINVVAPSGSCTRANLPYLPVISVGISGATSTISDCLGGVWVNAPVSAQANATFEVLSANSGGTAYLSLNTNGTTVVAGTLYCAELDVPVSKYATGLGIMFGTTAGGSDKHIAALLDSAGNVVATSALGGAVNSTASTYINFAFTSKYYVVGGAQYYACTQSNGTSDTIRMLVTGTQDTYLTTSKTGTFGTIPTITVPTTFTTAVGPYALLY